MLFTTQSCVTGEQLFLEFGSDFARKTDFIAWLKKNTEEHQCCICDAASVSEVEPRKRYYVYTADPDLVDKPWVAGCPAAWGVTSKSAKWAKVHPQRERWERPPEYKPSTLKRMYFERDSAITEDQLNQQTARERSRETLGNFEKAIRDTQAYNPQDQNPILWQPDTDINMRMWAQLVDDQFI